MTTAIIPATSSPDLAFLTGPKATMVRCQIVAFAVSDEAVKAICWPPIPAKARVYVSVVGGWQPFSLADGTATGTAATAPRWEQ